MEALPILTPSRRLVFQFSRLLFVPHHVREVTEQRELEALSKHAAKAAESLGRQSEEAQDPVRTCFQRDRDRILHSKSFRRLRDKTQVFISPQGDHYRTRLTHTLEVAQVARTIGRALRLNEDLIEAIALGHDVGHTPFGHPGEQALDTAIRDLNLESGRGFPDGFKHYEQSLRVLDVLENLNLTAETRAGIGGHSKGRADLSAHDGTATSTLEAAVVRISDRIAYLNHDLDDAVRSGIISEIPNRFLAIGDTQGRRIGSMVEDAIVNSLDRPAIGLSAHMLAVMNDLKEWLYERVYLNYPLIYPDVPKAQAIVRELFAHFLAPETLSEGYEGVQGTVDYVSGMTDGFAIELYASLKIPQRFRALSE